MEIGTAYYPEFWPESEWAKDLSTMSGCGIDFVRVGEFAWSWYESSPDVYDFRGLDRFMDQAAAIGLPVLLCTPTAAAPRHFEQAHPEALLRDRDGRIVSKGRHRIDWFTEAAAEKERRIVSTLAARYGKHRALMAWQIDNEPSIGETTDASYLLGYGERADRAFRLWLSDRYGSLERLNERWSARFWSGSYSDWSQIRAPRESCDPGPWLDWCRFRAEETAAFIGRQAALLRAQDGDHPIGTNMPACGISAGVFLAQNPWLQAAGLEYVGTDIYHYCGDQEEERRSALFLSDLFASAAASKGAEFWISEAQAGPHRLPWRKTFVGGLWEADFLERSAGTFGAAGAEKLCLFLWRAFPGGVEHGMNSLVESDGTPGERASRLPALRSAARAERAGRQNRPVAYLHYSFDSASLCAALDPDRTADLAYRGWHGMLDDLGFRTVFVDDGDLENLPPSGALLALPYSLSMGDRTIAAVRRAAASGIPIAAGPLTSFMDDSGRCITRTPGGLAELFGAETDGADVIASGLGAGSLGCRLGLRGAESLRGEASGLSFAVKGSAALFSEELGGIWCRAEPAGRAQAAETLRAALRSIGVL